MVAGTPLGLWLLTRLSANQARLTIGVLILGSVVVLGVACGCRRGRRIGWSGWSA